MAMTPLDYKCDICGKKRSRDSLVAKRVQFKEMGVSGRVIQTRTVAWLCRVKGKDGKTCLEIDRDYAREKYAEAPGTAAKKKPGEE